MFLPGPEEGALSPSPAQPQPEEAATTTTAHVPVTTTTASSIATAANSTTAGGGGGEGEKRRKKSSDDRETKTNRNRAKPGLRPTPPDLDLDLVDEERAAEERAAEEQRRKSEKQRRRSHTVREKNQDEQGRSSRSLPRNGARSWDRAMAEEGAGLDVSEKKRRHKQREDVLREDVKTVRHHVSNRAVSEPFSFLMARDNPSPSDSESGASFSEISQSAASIAWREESDRRRVDSEAPPGPWLKPSPQKLTQVLIGSRLSGRGLVGGLSL